MTMNNHCAWCVSFCAVACLAACSVYDEALLVATPASVTAADGGSAGASIVPVPAAPDASAASGSPRAGAPSDATAVAAPETKDDDAGSPGCQDPTDRDADGEPDCSDACPDDAAKSAPGICGCGMAESDTPAAASCNDLRAQILHRYTFDGTGTVVRDAYGMADAVLLGAELTGRGSVHLNLEAEGQAVSLPAGVVSRLSDATFEVWLTPEGDGVGPVFEFGASDTLLGVRRYSSLYLSLLDRGESVSPRAGYSQELTDVVVDAQVATPLRAQTHLAVVVDASAKQLKLFVDGSRADQATLRAPLSGLRDMHNMLGSSSNPNLGGFEGSLFEFRIYAGALSAAQIATSFRAGPDPVFLDR